MWTWALCQPYLLESRDVAELGKQRLGHNEVIVRFDAGSICGSDLAYYRGQGYCDRWGNRYGTAGWPLHEIVGYVVEQGDSDLWRGQRVVGWAKDQRGLAELFVCRAEQVFALGDDIMSVYATTMQPLACVIDALSRVEGVAGSNVLVIGLGPLGLLFAHVLRTLGARNIIGVDPIARGDLGREYGLNIQFQGLSTEWARECEAGDGDLADIVIEAVGHQVGTVNDAIASTAAGGTIYCFGVPDVSCYSIEFNCLFRKGITLMSGTTRQYRSSLKSAEDYLREHSGLAEGYITNIYTVESVQSAFATACIPKTHQGKVALVINDEY